MRVKALNKFPLLPGAKLVWDRITFSKLTTIYFLFSLLHCIIQVAFQTWAFMVNRDAANFLFSILLQGGAESRDEFPVLAPDYTLRMCKTVPSVADPVAAQQCWVIWDGEPRRNWISSSDSQSPPPSFAGFSSPAPDPTTTSQDSPQNNVFIPTASPQPSSTVTVFVFPTENPTLAEQDVSDAPIARRDTPKVQALSNGQVSVNVTGMGYDNTPAVLDRSCLWALNYPVAILENTKREDIVFICFQVWVLGMSFVALLNESIPHILASLMTHILATGWATYQIFHTNAFKSTFARVISNGACADTQLLGNFWQDRTIAEIPGSALNGLGLIISAFLTYRLFKLFGWQTFKRVGASLTINRLYKVVLTLSITIQLAVFFIVVTVSLWIDQLFNTSLGRQATLINGYKAGSFVVLALVLPWLATGWTAVRRESRLGMFFFLAMSSLYLSSWGVMFFSDTFRWLFLTWRFFSVMSAISLALTIVALILGVISRYNFGKGLPRYLAAQEELPGEDFVPVNGRSDPEKVSFPSSGPIPTFSATFGSGDEVPVPTKMFAPRQVGPRFFRSAEPFESSSERTFSDSPETHSPQQSISSSSDHSATSLPSYYSYSGASEPSVSPPRANRWVIE